MKTNSRIESENAVSPVIGVIGVRLAFLFDGQKDVELTPTRLMVAITVILAAVILKLESFRALLFNFKAKAAFIFGTVGTVKTTHIVGMTATKVSSDEIRIMNQGGQDVGKMTDLRCFSTPTGTQTSTGLTTGASTILIANVSGTYALKTEVTCVGMFGGNDEQVVYQNTL